MDVGDIVRWKGQPGELEILAFSEGGRPFVGRVESGLPVHHAVSIVDETSLILVRGEHA